MTELLDDTIYRRLGGHDELARIVGDWFERMKQDPDVCHLGGHDDAERRNSVRDVIAYLSAVALGSHIYSLHHQRIAHEAMGLSGGLWKQSADHLLHALVRNGVSDRLTGELISGLTGLREQVLLDAR